MTARADAVAHALVEGDLNATRPLYKALLDGGHCGGAIDLGPDAPPIGLREQSAHGAKRPAVSARACRMHRACVFN
jgi:hypothetical protein